MLRLYEQHVVGAREDAADRVGAGLDRLMDDMAAAAQRTDAQAGQFGQTLDALALTLRGELQAARSAAMVCPLTGVLNRKGFDVGLEAMAAAAAAPGREHCLVMLDLDRFKNINDSHRHVVGDRVLQAVGAVLRERVTGDGATAARHGGEEFAILLPRTGLARAVALAEPVRAAVHGMRIRRRDADPQPLRVTLSAGVAALRPGIGGTELVADAERALRRQAGRPRLHDGRAGGGHRVRGKGGRGCNSSRRRLKHVVTAIGSTAYWNPSHSAGAASGPAAVARGSQGWLPASCDDKQANPAAGRQPGFDRRGFS